tara:strand:+ start:19090 stop:20082 length:993 start_codon:yes stop_codon:yes gene_type:complete
MLKKTLDIIINLIPLKLFDIFWGHKVIGVEYHLSSDEKLPHINHLFNYKSNKELETDLLWLKNRYQFISLQEYYNNSLKKTKQKLLTFDDGYIELFTNVLPILEKHSIPAIFFLTTNFTINNEKFYRNSISLIIDKLKYLDQNALNKCLKKINDFSLLKNELDTETYIDLLKKIKFEEKHIIEKIANLLEINPHRYFLNKKQILELNKHLLITIGAHSQDHRDFRLCSDAEIKNQIIKSSTEIKNLINQKKVPFAFPFSSKNISRKVINEIKLEHPFITPFFGESSFSNNDELILKRFQGEKTYSPYHIKTVIRQEYIYHLKDSLKRIFK